jgi:mRNA interferase RelE/StbE
MPWEIILTKSARKDLRKISKPDQIRILDFLEHRLQNLDDPKTIGKSLMGQKYSGIWRYRVGNYRIFTRLEHNKLIITVIEIAHRSRAYER